MRCRERDPNETNTEGRGMEMGGRGRGGGRGLKASFLHGSFYHFVMFHECLNKYASINMHGARVLLGLMVEYGSTLISLR